MAIMVRARSARSRALIADSDRGHRDSCPPFFLVCIPITYTGYIQQSVHRAPIAIRLIALVSFREQTHHTKLAPPTYIPITGIHVTSTYAISVYDPHNYTELL